MVYTQGYVSVKCKNNEACTDLFDYMAKLNALMNNKLLCAWREMFLNER